MLFSISASELLAVLSFAVPTSVLYFRGDPLSRRMFVLTLCTAIASCVTPADLLSTAVLTAILILVYLVGVQMGTLRAEQT